MHDKTNLKKKSTIDILNDAVVKFLSCTFSLHQQHIERLNKSAKIFSFFKFLLKVNLTLVPKHFISSKCRTPTLLNLDKHLWQESQKKAVVTCTVKQLTRAHSDQQHHYMHSGCHRCRQVSFFFFHFRKHTILLSLYTTNSIHMPWDICKHDRKPKICHSEFTLWETINQDTHPAMINSC